MYAADGKDGSSEFEAKVGQKSDLVEVWENERTLAFLSTEVGLCATLPAARRE
jgi:hypothetical protein